MPRRLRSSAGPADASAAWAMARATIVRRLCSSSPSPCSLSALALALAGSGAELPRTVLASLSRQSLAAVRKHMPRPIWTGSISFGLVNVPIKLFSAVSPRAVRFHMLHDEDGGRIKNKRICSADDEEVPYEHIVKGYEIAKGQYVTATREELDA